MDTVGLSRETKRRGDIEWHSYRCRIHDSDGYPGCTTIINKMDKPFLAAWFKKQGARAALELLDTLPKMVEVSGVEATIEHLAKAADKVRDSKGDTGTRIHAAIEAIVKHEPIEIDEDIAESVAGFRKWANDRRPTIKAAEFMVISETHRYGATGDLALVTDLREWGLPQEQGLILVDAKTGFIGDTIALQLAAIANADHSGLPGDPKAYRVPAFTHYAALQVRPDGTELVPFDVTPAEFQAFLACRDLYEWTKTRARKVMTR